MGAVQARLVASSSACMDETGCVCMAERAAKTAAPSAASATAPTPAASATIAGGVAARACAA